MTSDHQMNDRKFLIQIFYVHFMKQKGRIGVGYKTLLQRKSLVFGSQKNTYNLGTLLTIDICREKTR